MNKIFKELREKKGFSQEKLAEKLYVSVKTIRKWERGDSIPEIESIKSLAVILDIDEKDIMGMFDIENTEYNKAMSKHLEMGELFANLFWTITTHDQFFKLCSLFSDLKYEGVIIYNDSLFHFSKIITDNNIDAAVLSDSNDNYVTLTPHNVNIVKPISFDYDIFAFCCETHSPIFPLKDNKSKKQQVKIYFYKG